MIKTSETPTLILSTILLDKSLLCKDAAVLLDYLGQEE